MYELTQEWIQKNLDNDTVVWTDRQRAMLQGMSEYTKTSEESFEKATDQLTNPGLQPELPEDNNGSEENN